MDRFREQREIERKPNSGGQLRRFSGETVEELPQLVWNSLLQEHGCAGRIVKEDKDPIRITDNDGNFVDESVDQHCYIGNNLVLAIESKTYLDKCYLQRADYDFMLMKNGTDKQFATVILSLEDSIMDSSYNFFMGRGNIDRCFILADGKRNSDKDKRIYNNPERVRIEYIEEFVDYMDSFF